MSEKKDFTKQSLRWMKIALVAAGCLAGVGVLFLLLFYLAFRDADMTVVEENRASANKELMRVAREVELGRTTETLGNVAVLNVGSVTSGGLEVTDRRSVDFFGELVRLDAAYRELTREQWPKPVHSRIRYVWGEYELEKVGDPLRGKETGGKAVWESLQQGPRQLEAMERFFRWKEARDEAEKESRTTTTQGMPTAERVIEVHRFLDEVDDFLLRTEWRVGTGEEINEWQPSQGRLMQPTMLCIARACREGDETKARLLYLRAIDMVRILTATPRLSEARVSVLGLSVVYAGESRDAGAGLREGVRRLEGFRLTREQAKVRFLADLRLEGEANIRSSEVKTVYHKNVWSKLDRKLNQIFVVAPVRALQARALDAIEREDVHELNGLRTQAFVLTTLFDAPLDSFFRRFETIPLEVHPEWKKILRLDTVFSRFTENEEVDRGQAVLACLAYRAEHGAWPGSMSEAGMAREGVKRDGAVDVEWRPLVFEGFRYPLINRPGDGGPNAPQMDAFSKAVQEYISEHGRVPTVASELSNVTGRPYFDEAEARERFENFPGFWAVVEVRRGQFKQTELGKIMAERQRDLSAPPTAKDLARLYGTDEGREIVTIEGIAISMRGTGIQEGDWLIRKPSRGDEKKPE